MVDAEFLERFERGVLSPASFRHADHIKAAWLMLRAHSAIEGLTRFCTGIRNLALAAGHPERYHETITWTYLLLIRERMQRLPTGHTWEAFGARNADLFAWNPGILERLYRKETLDSEFARRCFVLPDRALSH